MLKVALALDAVSVVVAPLAIGVFLVAWLVGAYAILFVRRRDAAAGDKLFRRMWLTGVCTLAPLFVMSWISTTVVRHNILSQLQQPIIGMEVDGRPAKRPEILGPELAAMRSMPAHHSHPTNRVRVTVISTTNRILLVLRQDSSDPNEYWVFDPRLRQEDEIARVTMSSRDMAVIHYAPSTPRIAGPSP